MTEKYIQMIEELKLVQIKDHNDLETWKSKATNIVRRIYGKESAQENQIENINYKAYSSVGIGTKTIGGGNNLDDCKKRAFGLADVLIAELNVLGLPAAMTSNPLDKINITVNQSQTQEQTIKLKVIISALQDELNGNQLKELQDILDTQEEPNTKRNKLFEKAKSFGGDVLANVIANLLTNPLFS